MATSFAKPGAPAAPVLATCPQQRVSGVVFDSLRRDEAVAICCDALDRGDPLTIGVVNAAKAVNMRSDEALAKSVAGADIVLADGQSIVWASRLLRRPLPERVAGIDLFTDLLAVAESRGESVYFLGATPEALGSMLTQLKVDYPALRIAGSRDGYFDLDSEGAGIAAEIRASRAQLLFVGMPSPRKEIFLARHATATGAVIRHGVGGSFDVIAGITRRAPMILQRCGLEWLFRLLQEPRRLGRRYAVTNTAFLAMVARERFGRDRTSAFELPKSSRDAFASRGERVNRCG
jgi:N-acetylglucosaminyldiphosphoundecaprenol N-acetyl-beta-D-mannosaminyltransferase